MKRILATGSIAVLASLGVAASANAAPNEAACFGQNHKAVNSGALGYANVGELVHAKGGGQGKNAFAASLC